MRAGPTNALPRGMMKALLTSLLLATTTTVALADDGVVQTRPHIVVAHDGKVALANNLEISARKSAHTFVEIDPKFPVRQIRVERNDGRVRISRVQVLFANGRHQTIASNILLSDANAVAVLRIPRGRVKGVVFETQEPRQARGAGTRGPLAAHVDVIGFRR